MDHQQTAVTMKWWEWLVVAFLLVQGAILLYAPVSSTVQSKVAPVVVDVSFDPASVRRAEFNGAEGIIFSATAEKLRDCNWQETKFFFGARNELSAFMPRAQHLGPPSANATGLLYWEEIFVPVVDYEQLQRDVWADAIHDCKGVEVTSPFWN